MKHRFAPDTRRDLELLLISGACVQIMPGWLFRLTYRILLALFPGSF